MFSKFNGKFKPRKLKELKNRKKKREKTILEDFFNQIAETHVQEFYSVILSHLGVLQRLWGAGDCSQGYLSQLEFPGLSKTMLGGRHAVPGIKYIPHTFKAYSPAL